MIPGLPFDLHPFVIAVALAVGLVVHVLAERPSARLKGWVAAASLYAVMAWPFGDLAQRVSLSAAVIQRLVLMLAVVPLALGAIPLRVVDRLTRPAPIDAVARWIIRPLPVLGVVTVLGTLTASPTLVDWGARSSFGHLVVLGLIVLAGALLWAPVFGVVPGTRRLSPAGRAGFIFAASLVVTSLSIVWVFARHPMYPDLAGQREIIGISPLADQQAAGFIAKLGAYLPMWVMAAFQIARADDDRRPVEGTPLYLADIDRQVLRAERRQDREVRRESRRPLPEGWDRQ